MTEKDKAMAVLESLPANLSFDDCVKELAFVAMIDCGISDSKNGRHVSSDDMIKKVRSWQ